MSLITGAEWERAIGRRHDLYVQAGLALCERTTPPAEMGRGGRLRQRRAGPPDFAVTVDGVRVLVEAKVHSREDATWKLSNLKSHQADALGAAEAGAVLLRWAHPMEPIDGVLLIGWRALGPFWRRWAAGAAEAGEASLTKQRALSLSDAAWAVADDHRKWTCPDYLPALRAMLRRAA